MRKHCGWGKLGGFGEMRDQAGDPHPSPAATPSPQTVRRGIIVLAVLSQSGSATRHLSDPLACADEDRIDDRIKFAIDLVIPEAQDDESEIAKKPIAFGVSRASRLEAVLEAIDLDGDERPQARKVQHILAAWNLPSKVQTLWPQRTEPEPKFHFLRRHRLSQRAGFQDGHPQA